ncbi:MAG: hypothetical protein ACT4PJ_06735 [Gemmatimonadaceae bacterium]
MSIEIGVARPPTRGALRIACSIGLIFGAMCMVAYALGSLTRTEWMVWLAPVTVALDSILFLERPGHDTSRPFASAPDTREEADVPVHLGLTIIAACAAAWAAYTGNRVALILGASFAVLGKVLQRRAELTHD